MKGQTYVKRCHVEQGMKQRMPGKGHAMIFIENSGRQK